MGTEKRRPDEGTDRSVPIGGSSPGRPELLKVGWVGRAHGLGGEVEVKLAWSDSSAMAKAKRLGLQRAGGPEVLSFQVASARRGAKGFLVRLRGVDDRAAAERLRGSSVYVERDELEPLLPGEYYLGDVVDLEVVRGGQRLGVVRDAVSYPSVDVAVVEAEGGTIAQLLLLEDGSVRVDVEGKRIELADHVSLLDPDSGEPLP